LAKVADVDYALGKEQAASEGFQEALKKLENLSIPAGDEARMLEKKVSFSSRDGLNLFAALLQIVFMLTTEPRMGSKL
jgi:hypothetical protein